MKAHKNIAKARIRAETAKCKKGEKHARVKHQCLNKGKTLKNKRFYRRFKCHDFLPSET